MSIVDTHLAAAASVRRLREEYEALTAAARLPTAASSPAPAPAQSAADLDRALRRAMVDGQLSEFLDALRERLRL